MKKLLGIRIDEKNPSYWNSVGYGLYGWWQLPRLLGFVIVNIFAGAWALLVTGWGILYSQIVVILFYLLVTPLYGLFGRVTFDRRNVAERFAKKMGLGEADAKEAVRKWEESQPDKE